MNCVRNKLLFWKETSFKEFLKDIIRSGLHDTSIFVSIAEDASGALDEEGRSLLKQIGLDSPLCVGGSYTGAVVSDGICQEYSEQEKVTLSGENGILCYRLESAGENSEGEPHASVIINDVEYAKGQRGFNFVLFDDKIGQLITSKCFNTSVEADPIES